jgi:hypothetical protein
MRSPLQIASLLRLARRYRVALRSLQAVAALGKLEPPSATAGTTSGASPA